MNNSNRVILILTIISTVLFVGLSMVNCRSAIAAPSQNFNVKNLDASQLRIANVKLLDSDGTYPICSPDGTKILYTVFASRDSHSMYQKQSSRAQIWVMDVNGKNKRLIITDGEYGNWSPDGKKIVYRSFRKQTYTLGIYDFSSKKDIRFEIDLASNTAGNMYPYWSINMKSIILFYKGLFGIPSSILVDIVNLDNLEVKGIRKRVAQISAGESLPILPDNLEETVLMRNKAHPIFNVVEVVYHGPKFETQIQSLAGGPSFKLFYPICLKKGIWAINKNATYYNFLTNGCNPQLSPDLTKVIFSRLGEISSKGIFIGNLERLPFNKFYELELGTEDGLISGDLFVIYEKKVNPLNNKIIGYHPKKIKGSGVIVRRQNNCSLLKINVKASNIQLGDIAALPMSNIWKVLQKAKDIEKIDKGSSLINSSRYSTQAITKVISLKKNPNAIEILSKELNSSTASTVAIAAEALGRIGGKQAEQELIHRLRELLMKGAFSEACQSIIWTLRQINTKLRFKSKDGIINVPTRDIVTIKSKGNFPPLTSVRLYLKDGSIIDCSLELAASVIKEGIALYKKGDLSKAIEVTKKAYEIDPKNPYSSYNLACYYSIKGNIDKGIKWLDKAYPLIINSNKYRKLLRNAKRDKDLNNLKKHSEFKQRFPKFVK